MMGPCIGTNLLGKMLSAFSCDNDAALHIAKKLNVKTIVILL